MDKFKYKGLVEILHLNTRKEGPEEDKVLAADVKMTTTVGREVLDFFEPALAACLFIDGGAVRNEMMGPIQFHNQLEHYRLETFGSTFHGVTVKKFVIEPKDVNQIVLTFAVSFKPSGTEVAKLAEYLQDAIQVVIEPENGELDLGGAVEAARNMDKMLKEQGDSATLTDGKGNVLGTFGVKATV